ncbi:MAG TPA: NapC/NirT family cytochrome c [Anaerolineales bacterium]|nr:NapC/NirT family cytochrome c [Anaerolineales bacterium]
MKQLRVWLRSFFFPAPSAPRYIRLLPYTVLGMMTLALMVSGAYAWDYTNSPPFCGEACHTMPPEYTAYQVSPHARVACVECHIGREFVGNQIVRKAGDIKHIVSLASKRYEFPITADEMRPARETCERCHFPEKFSDDSFRQIRHYGDDQDNTPTSIYLFLKTGGGSKRQGLGRGIHWHVENRVLYYPTDKHEQTIPYIRVYNDDGTVTEYTDITANFDAQSVSESGLKEMDCITCHNRITHRVNTPEASMDKALERKVIAPDIPDIHRKGVEVLYANYTTQEQGLNGIAGLVDYYRVYYPDYFANNQQTVLDAVAAIQDIYRQTVFLEQKSDWNSHSNNVGHKDFPGCFRCHDGKHLDNQQQAIRLECNLCHSIPVVAGPQDFVTKIEISRGPEPESHLNSNWIAGHRTHLDQSCALCHTTSNPGGTDNTSFCSNSACHGASWRYAGLDAPKLAEVVAAQLPTPTPAPTPAPVVGVPTYLANIQPIFESTCVACHGESRAGGLSLMTYADALAGSSTGPVITPGDVENSALIEVQTGDHFGKLTGNELELVKQWIAGGAPEK